MRRAVIVDAVRTPIGRANAERGYYRDIRSDELARYCVEALLQRTGIDPARMEYLVLGNTQQVVEQIMEIIHAASIILLKIKNYS